MTLRGGGGGVACDANFLLVYSFFLLAITQRFCCNYANSIARVILLRVTLYQMLEFDKDTTLPNQATVAMSHNKHLIDTVREGV